jgi:Rieske 2Fe-2S family protein
MAQEIVRKRKAVEGATTLPGRYYSDEGIFRQEVDKLFQSMWLCAGRVDEIPNPGDYLVREIGCESIVVVRDEKEAIRAFYNNCRHRGTRLCLEESGSAKGSFQCQYHAWTYGLDGQLLGAPHMNEVPTFRKEDWPLKSVGCEVWEGHIFINLDENRAPLSEQLGDMPQRFARYRMGELRRARRIEYDVAANWKLIVENYSECYHCPLIHPDLNRVTHYLSGQNDVIADTYNGGYQIIGEQYCTLTVEGKKTRPYFRDIRKEDQNRVYYYEVYPNLLLSLHPDYMMTHTAWPKSAALTHVVCEWHFEPEVMARPEFDPSDAVGFWDMTNRQDWRACEISQLGVQSRGYTPGPFSNQEELIYNFDRFVLDRLEGPAVEARQVARAR